MKPYHEYLTTERVPYSGTTDYYKVHGVNSWEELRAYFVGLPKEEKARFARIVQLNGHWTLERIKEEFTD